MHSASLYDTDAEIYIFLQPESWRRPTEKQDLLIRLIIPINSYCVLTTCWDSAENIPGIISSHPQTTF